MKEKIEELSISMNIPFAVTGVTEAAQVTRYQVMPAVNEKGRLTSVAAIKRRAADFAVALGKKVAIVCDDSGLFIEIAKSQSIVRFEPVGYTTGKLNVSLGVRLNGGALVLDAASAPHLLIAGTTGSGKSVLLQSIIAQLADNPEVELYLIDPKKVELSKFSGKPRVRHYTTPGQGVELLAVALEEINTRYEREERSRGYISRQRFLVVAIDELAELLLGESGKEAEKLICRIAAIGRAAKVHLIVATQRPSTDVVTGLIKANFPTRVCLRVATGIDSRVVIDMPGAETLLGNGDGLLLKDGRTTRFQGMYITDADMRPAGQSERVSDTVSKRIVFNK